MKQITPKRLVEALYWLHNNPHHHVGIEWPRSMPASEQTMENWSHHFYANYHEKLRIPAILCEDLYKYVVPNKRKFDTRMFALTRAGKALIDA